MTMIHLKIDDQDIQVEEGRTILEAAQAHGIAIPTLCHQPDLTPYGACRLCVVEVSRNGRSTITASCAYPVEEGIEVRTDTPEVLQTRKVMAGLVLSRCPEVPAIQRIAAEQGVLEPPFATDEPEQDCILCGLCVRACHEIAGQDILGFVERGGYRRVTTAFDRKYAICDDCNQCIPYCPTGAITGLEAPRIGERLRQVAERWIRARQVVQYGALALFLLLIAFTTRSLVSLPMKVNLFSLLDPLQAVGATIASRELIPWYALALVTVGATLWLGRAWCGWICPLGAILELFGKPGTRTVSQQLRYIKYVILFAVLLMAVFGSLAFMFFDPITILVRGVAGTLVPIIQAPFNGFEKLGRIGLVAAIPLLVVLGLNFVERRFWCRYLCPLGALVGLLSKFSWTKRRVDKFACVKCGECAGLCTMGAIETGEFTSDPAECITCMDCAAPCPQRAISFTARPGYRGTYEFNPARREFLASAGTAAAAIGVLSLDLGKSEKPHLLRPPGVVDEDAFLAKCIRCGQCVKACSTHALHPATLEAGWDAFGTPVLKPYLGYCNYDCHACGHVCPSGAIPPLSLEEKRKQVIGTAYVKQELCISCNLCYGECPVEGTLLEVEGERKRKKVIFPHVEPDLCIGCGACESVCPVEGELAIRVYAPGFAPQPTAAIPRGRRVSQAG